MPSDEAVPSQRQVPLDAALASVLERLNSDSGIDERRVEITRELNRLRELLAAERAQRSVVERLRESLGSDVSVAVDLSESEKSASSPSDELVANLAAHSPRESRYKINGEIARGGMGAILRAFDPDLRRTLAMKVALERAQKSDDKQRERIARFLEEAQITGQLDHPGVVPVHELGLDPTGRLYFTMRLVKGRDLGAIYELAREGAEDWSMTRVLGVLLKVCEAMAYAHSKGVIHRDLKPANVMVGRFGEVYVMDWGLAKVLGRKDGHDLRVPEDAASTIELRSVRSDAHDIDPTTPLLTLDGTVLGTPAYMSPEQARGEIERMDARSDVYALGAMLYQLLAGCAPYQDAKAKHDARRVWMRILQSGPEPLHVLAPQTAPELLAIVERAMAREVSDRYPDMQALGDDLRAWLEGRVVQAYETGNWARMRKWVGRNKPLAASLAAGVFVLVAGSVVSSYYAVYAKQQAHSALLESDTSQEVVSFLTGMLERPDPARARGKQLTVQDVLDSAAARIDAEFEAQPELRARLMHTMARVYKSLDLLPQAEALLQQVLVIRRPLLGDSHEDTLDALVALGHLHHMNRRADLARPLYEEVLTSTQRKFGDAHLETRKARSQLANVYETLDEDAAAEREYLAAIGPDDGSPAAASAEVLTIRSNLAALYLKLQRYEEARVLLDQVYQGHVKNLGPDSEPALFTLTNMAGLYQVTGRLEDAVRLASEVLDRRTIKDTLNHPWTLQAALALGQMLLDSGRPDLAEPVLRSAFEGCRNVLPPSHQQTLDSMRCMVRLLKAQGKLKAAATLAQELLDATPVDSPKRADYQAIADSLLDSSLRSDAHEQEK